MTRLFGVIGSPIGHSLSPAMHSAAFKALKMDAVYSPFDVPPAHLRPMLRALVLSGVEGLNVTVPLKEAILPLLDAVDPAAKAIGAVNTVVVRNHRTTGYNTDIIGFHRALVEDTGFDPRGKRILVVGAGGAAKAVACALLRLEPAGIGITDRINAKARQLAKLLLRLARAGSWCPPRGMAASGCAAIPWRPRMSNVLEGVDLLVNATPVGMKPADPTPIELAGLRREAVVYDLIYHRKTKLIQQARLRGCVASGGLPMLLYQGAESFRLWTRRRPPIAVMRRALERAVKFKSQK